MSTRHSLIEKVDQFLALTDMDERTFSRLALGDPRKISAFREGASMNIESLDRLVDFMATELDKIQNSGQVAKHTPLVLQWAPEDHLAVWGEHGWEAMDECVVYRDAIPGRIMKRRPKPGETWQALVAELASMEDEAWEREAAESINTQADAWRS